MAFLANGGIKCRWWRLRSDMREFGKGNGVFTIDGTLFLYVTLNMFHYSLYVVLYVGWADKGFGNTMEEEGRRRRVQYTRHPSTADLIAVVSVGWADKGFGNTMEEEGRRTTPSSAARAVHAPSLHNGSDGSGQAWGTGKWGTYVYFLLFPCNLFGVLGWLRVEVKVSNFSCASGEVGSGDPTQKVGISSKLRSEDRKNSDQDFPRENQFNHSPCRIPAWEG
ncbi:hypothetical protein Cgig2_013371 [Carnegiea gigantea]|uniref:Uncharacterized protein n=1 Tax=Carnegiea gigantea TaxID=171969 RepID=A0A9Q1K7N8_9CARY|nr:hypothetical protein Cgig2_013371 [Carnegiea gigantea]